MNKDFKIPETIAKACRIGVNDNLRDSEIEWINKNAWRYEGDLHRQQVIKNIKYNYQIKALSF